jgi:hypothetical protein
MAVRPPRPNSFPAMRYARVPIGDATFLLPLSAEMVMQDFYGGENRNVITFSRCRQYSGESSLSFDEAPEDAVAQPTAPPVPIALPEGLLVEIDLQTPVNFPGSAIGDEIEGRIHRDVKRKGKVVIPKGALVKGNVVLLERRRDMRGQVRILVALSWREISFDGKSGPFEGQLEEGGAIPASDISNRGPLPASRPAGAGYAAAPRCLLRQKGYPEPPARSSAVMAYGPCTPGTGNGSTKAPPGRTGAKASCRA